MKPARTAHVPLALAILSTFGLAGPSRAASPRAELVRGLEAALAEARRSLEAGELEDAERRFRQAREEAGPLGEITLPRARAIEGLADVCHRAGRRGEARELYGEALRAYRELFGSAPQPRLAITRHNLAIVLAELGATADAEREFDAALAVWEAVYGPDSEAARNTRRARRAALAASAR